jgi:glutamate-1-semialdehyde 2,1-aminomutase
MFTCFFSGAPVTDYACAKRSDTVKFARFFRSLLELGVYFPPSQFEAAFVSTAHSEADVTLTVAAAAKAFDEIRRA